MFLIRRRSDGKWWRNLGYHNSYGKDHWADKPDGIRPFKTVGGCKTAMSCFCYDKIEVSGAAYPFNFKYVKNKAKFDQQFEIIPVRIEIA